MSETNKRTEPYTFVGEARRFDQRYTAFARARWDSTSVAYGKRNRPVEDADASGKPGYSFEDFALHAGAWAVARENRRTPETDDKPEEMVAAEDRRSGRREPDDRGAFTRRVKQAARLYGASMVGVTRLNPLWLYARDGAESPAELPQGVDTAIVIAVEMDYEMIRSSPAVTAAAATGKGYSQMAFITTCVARYLTQLGWQAIPCGNDTALSIPLAIDAGLGELGRNGLLITPLHGPRVRLCKVFTDAPLVEDAPIRFGVKEFCDRCMKCAESCPSGSISRGAMTAAGPTPSNNPGALKWYCHADRCLAFWRANGASCSNCIRSCPFNKPQGWLHDWVRAFIKAQSRSLDRAFVFFDGLCGYGAQKSPDSL